MARVARLGVVIDSSGAKRGANETNSALNGMSATAMRAQRTIVQAMSAIGAALGIREVVQLADSWTRLEGRLKTVTSSAAELAMVQRQLVAVANTTRMGIEETITLYTRLARTAGELGVSQSDVVRLTELTAKTLVVSGTSATQASGALLQFSQALGGGVVRAEEFNSILEGTPVIVQEVAKSMGVTVAELRNLVIAGEVTSTQFAEAFLDATGRIDDSFAKLGPTVEGALTQLSNAFAEAIGRGNAAGGATQELAAAIVELAAMIRENQATFDAMGEALATMLRWSTAAGDAFIKAGDAVDRLGDYIAGAAKATEGLANFDTKAWTEGITMMTKANADYEESVRRVGRALVTTRKEASGMSSEGAAFMRNLTGGGMGGSVGATPFGMMGGLGGGAAAASRARVAPAAKADADAMREAAKAAKELQEALDKTAFSSGLARQRAIENANALREFVTPVKLSFAEVLNFVQAQERAAGAAKMHANAVRLGIADTVSYRAEVEAVTRVEELRSRGITVTVESVERLKSAIAERIAAEDAANGKTGANVKATQEWDSALQSVSGTLRDISQALNGTGNDAVKMIGLIAAALDGLARAQQRAEQMRKAGQKVSGAQAVGTGLGGAAAAFGTGLAVGSTTTNRTTGAVGGTLAGAVSGATTGAALGVSSGPGIVLTAAVGAVIGAIGGLLGASNNATQALIAQRAAQLQLNEALSTMRASFAGDGLAQALSQASAQFVQLRQQTEAAFSGKKNESERNRVLAELNALEVQRLAIIRQQYEEGMRLAMGDLKVRELRAAGADVEADRMAESLAAQKELNDAQEKFGKDSPYVAALKKVQEAEAAAAEQVRARVEAEKAAQQVRDRTAFGLDLTQRRQTLSGDTRGAFITGQTIQSNSALAEAQKLVEAGTITAAMFEELKTLIGDEMAQAIRDFDAAAAESVRQQREDLEVRALVAQGRTAEAAQRRIEIANRRELQGVTDEALRAEIIRVQVLEEAARAIEAAAEAERRHQEQNADIDRRTIDVYKILDPKKAAELEQRQQEIDRVNELKGAADDATRARLQELYAMEDAAEAAVKLATAQEEQARIAEELASFTQSLNVQYLRSQGRGFDADVAELDEWRTEQRKRASATGAGPDALLQIDAIYASRYNALVRRSMGMDEPIRTPELTPSATDSTILGEETTAVRSARSISESSALQLVDYAASQLAVQREILAEIRGRRESGGALLASPSLDRMERQLGQRASTAAMLLGGSVR